MDWGPAVLHDPLIKWWLPLVLTAVLLWIDAHFAAMAPRLRRAAVAVVLLTATAFGGLCLARVGSNVLAPPAWDMGAFWLFGKVAASGGDFYQPAAFHDVAAALPPADAPFAGDEEFRQDVLDVGFPYPPPSILLVAPLGHLHLRTASLWWNAIQVLALAAVIAVFWRLFFAAHGWAGLALSAALVLTFRATYATLKFGQINFLVLLLFLAFWQARARAAGGVALALAVIGKPVLVFAAPFLLPRRRWSAALAATLTVAGAFVLTALMFGTRPLLTYATDNPVGRRPAWVYSIPENQSLLAEIVRRRSVPPLAAMSEMPFLIAAAAIVALTGALALRLGDTDADLALAATIPAALLVYPQSWEHYAVFLLLPIFVLWRERAALRIPTAAAIALVAVLYALVRYDQGSLVFFASLLTWGALAGLAVRSRGIHVASAAPRVAAPIA